MQRQITKPDSITETSSGTEHKIVVRWLSWGAIAKYLVYGAGGFLPLGFLFIQYGGRGREVPDGPDGFSFFVALVICVLVTVPAVLVSCFRIVRNVFNKTTVTINPTEVVATTGPLPPRSRHAFKRSEIRQVCLMDKTASPKQNRGSYLLLAVLRDGSGRVLVPHIRSLAVGDHLERAIERKLLIENTSVKGTVGQQNTTGMVVRPPTISVAKPGPREVVITRLWSLDSPAERVLNFIRRYTAVAIILTIMGLLSNWGVAIVFALFVFPVALYHEAQQLLNSTVVRIQEGQIRVSTGPIYLGDPAAAEVATERIRSLHHRKVIRQDRESQQRSVHYTVCAMLSSAAADPHTAADEEHVLIDGLPSVIEAVYLQTEIETALGLPHTPLAPAEQELTLTNVLDWWLK